MGIMQTLKFNCKYACLITCLFLTTYSTISWSQCTGGNSINLPKYTSFQLVKDFDQTGIVELSGLTYVDGNEFVLISDDRTNTNGTFSAELASYNDQGATKIFTLYNTEYENCTDFESITYIDTDPNDSSVHRFAFSEEKQRKIVVLTLDLDGTTNLFYPPPADIINLVGIPGVPANDNTCSSNDGIEGLAYDPQTGRMYVGLETGEIYYFDFASASSTAFTPTSFIELDDIDIVDYSTLSGMDVLPNGNLVLLATINNDSSNDTGEFDRKLIEVDPCGCVISQLDLFSIAGLENDELEGVAYRMGDLYIVGEFGIMYKLIPNPNVPILTVISPPVASSLALESGFQIQWSIVPNISQSQLIIELFLDNTSIYSFTSGTANDGTFSTVLPSEAIASAGTGYRIKVTSTTDPTITAFSAYFEITECQNDLTINNDAGSSDNQQAEFTITADNVIADNSNAIYHAGNEVLLTDGFVAIAGSTFRAYIEGCSDQFEQLQEASVDK